MQHCLCNVDLHLSIQADIKDILWSLWFKHGACIVSFITYDPQWQIHMSALLQTHLPLTTPTTSVFSIISYYHLSKTKKSSWNVSFFPPITIPLCVMFLHILHPLQHRTTQLLFSSHSWLIEGREMQIWWDRSDPWNFATCRIVLVLLNCGGKIAGGHDLDGDLSNPIASRWSPTRTGHAIRADNVLQ